MKPLRVILTEINTNETQRESKNFAKALRDSGFEVIPLGAGFSARQVARAAGQEDVDALCLWWVGDFDKEKFVNFLNQCAKELDGAAPVFLCGDAPAEMNDLSMAGANLTTLNGDMPFADIVETIKKTLDKSIKSSS